jgi:competence protein ComEA
MELTGAQRLLVLIGVTCLLAGVVVISVRSAQGARTAREMQYLPPETAVTPTKVAVHVAGEVGAPGVYWLTEGLRVQEAIRQAGGFTDQADPSSVNLAAVIEDGLQVKVARRRDVAAGTLSTPVVEPRPAPAPAPAMVQTATQSAPAAVNSQQLPPAAAASPPPLSLNRATKAELEALPDVGPELAARILYYRYEHGGFRSVEELQKIEGIGAARLAKLRPYVQL